MKIRTLLICVGFLKAQRGGKLPMLTTVAYFINIRTNELFASIF